MAREKECFRDNLCRLDERFPDRELLSISDVMAWTGRSRGYIERQFGKKFIGKKNEKKFISKSDLARAVSSSGGI